jgi:hypothetical protein
MACPVQVLACSDCDTRVPLSLVAWFYLKQLGHAIPPPQSDSDLPQDAVGYEQLTGPIAKSPKAHSQKSIFQKSSQFLYFRHSSESVISYWTLGISKTEFTKCAISQNYF